MKNYSLNTNTNSFNGADDEINNSRVNLRTEPLSGPDANSVRSDLSSRYMVSNNISGPDGYTSIQHNGILRKSNTQFTDAPGVEDGTLSFRDRDHIKSYLQYLEDTSNSLGQDFGDLSQEEFFEYVEQKLGFTSLRATVEQASLELANQTYEKPFIIPDDHFISDMLFRSFLNPQSEVRIGNNIIRFINKNVAISVPTRNSSLVSLVRQLPYSISLTDAKVLETQYPKELSVEDWVILDNDVINDRVFHDGYTVDINDILNIGPVISLGGTGSAKPTTDWFVAPKIEISAPHGCANPTLIKIANLFLQKGSTPTIGKFEISWGDGSVDYYVSSDLSGIVSPAPTHQYSTAGKKEIKFKAWEIDAATKLVVGPVVDEKTDIVNIGCSINAYVDSVWQEQLRPDTYRLVKGKHSITKWFGNPRTKAESKAYHWEKKTGSGWGYWPYSAKKLYVKYWLTYYPNDCNVAIPFSGEASQANCKEIAVYHTHSGPIGWHKITSRHELHTDDGKPPVVIEFSSNSC